MTTKRLFEKDHPRVCGEKMLPGHAKGIVTGSPPRVRGEVVFISIPIVFYRITPACAGRRHTQGGGVIML